MSDNNHKTQLFNGQKVRTVWKADDGESLPEEDK